MDFLLGVLTTQALTHGQGRGAQLVVQHPEVTDMRNTGATHGFPKVPENCSRATHVGCHLAQRQDLEHLKNRGDFSSKIDTAIAF